MVPSVLAAKPSAARPRGVKRTKTAMSDPGSTGSAVEWFAESVTGVKEEMTSSNKRKADLAGLALDAKLEDMLDDGAEKQTMVRYLLRRARQTNTSAPTNMLQQRRTQREARRPSSGTSACGPASGIDEEEE